MDRITSTPYSVSVAHVTETMTLNTTNADPIDSNVIVEESILVVDTGVLLTIDQGKTLIPDVYNVS
jgi:hypothetical protein